MFQDPKYAIFAVNRATGRIIPPHVPLMLFSARDRMALTHAVRPYAQGCQQEANALSAEQVASAQERAQAFADFQADHPADMKMPGTPAPPVAEPSYPVPIDGCYTYWLSGGNVVQFVKPQEDGTLFVGTTNEEVLDMLLHRIGVQNAANPSPTNDDLLAHLRAARTLQARRMREMGATPAPGNVLFGIRMVPCKSSNLEAYGYSDETQTLALQFRGGRIYHYAKVPRATYDALLASESLGGFAAREITTGQFEGRAVGNASEPAATAAA